MEIRKKNERWYFMKKQGFTLAEVLITLVIIGIIAAMTLPSLLGGTNKQEIKTALQKAMSTLSQAVTLHYALTGEDFGTISSYENFAKARLTTKDINEDVVVGQDGIVYDFGSADGASVASADNFVLVDVNGHKGPTATTNSSILTTNLAAEETTADSTLNDVKDVFKIYVYGTNLTVSKPAESGTFTRTLATDFLDDCLTTSGNSCTGSDTPNPPTP